MAKGPYDGSDYYYNEETVKVTFTMEEANAEDEQWKAAVRKDGEDYSEYTVEKNAVTFDLSEEGKYTDIQISGQDLAGNPLTQDADVSLTDENADLIQAEGDTAEADGVVTMTCNKVVDRTAPVAEITCTAAEHDHMYDDDIEDGVDYKKLAYYPSDITVEIKVTDQYGTHQTELDGSKISFGNTGTYEKAGEDSASTVSQINYTWDTDGQYFAGAYGTDRAGNALTVKEQIPDKKDQFVTTKGCEDSYAANYLLIRDTTAPVYELAITSEGAAVPKKNADYGNRYYFNKDFQTTITVTDENYDSARIYVKRAQEEADDQTNSQTADLADKQGFSKTIEKNAQNDTEFIDIVSEDGIYRYMIYGTDRAGNALVPASENENNTENVSETTLEVEAADFADKEQQDQETEAELSVHIVRDTIAPEVDVAVKDNEEFYRAVLKTDGTYEQTENKPYRSRQKASATVEVTDFSPAALKYQFTSSNAGAKNTNAAYNGQKYYKNEKRTGNTGIQFNGEQKVRITELTAVDLAGNRSTASAGYNGAVSTWMYLDVTPPDYDELAPNVEMKLSGDTKGRAKGSVYGPDGNALYTSNVTAEVTVEDPNWGNASGLYKVYYKAEVNGSDWTDRVSVKSSTGTVNRGVIDYGTAGPRPGQKLEQNENLTRSDHITVTFDRTVFNYNDVKLTVWAEDNSGNIIKEGNRVSRGFGIDITDPVIEVRYDNNDVRNNRYFNADRVATITVTERNFDENNTPIDTQSGVKISNWDHQKGNAANGDDDTWTCTVTYDTDGDYTFGVKTTDLAGNSMKGDVDYGNSAVPTDFTIDKTAPIINITFDNEDVRNGKYYNAARTATIEVVEHNFSGDGAIVTVGAAIAEGSVSAPGITGWSSGNDRNVTTVPFTADGDYTMQVEYTDLAGNVAEMKTVEEFTVDTTVPVIEIGGVEPNSANRGEVAPSITYHDINYDAALTSVSIVGYKNRDGKNLNGSAQENSAGGSFVCTNIEEIPENDDVYLCTGHVEDLAGNSSEAELRFSVNRFGSNYILDDPTQDLVDSYYTNQAPQIHITEINVNTLEFQEITATLNGEIMNLEEGTDYQVTESGDENSWKEYQYTISSAYFQKDGAYNVTVHSRDMAENENSNRTSQVAEYSKPVDFVLDTTAPEIVISGVEQDTQYVEDARTVTLLAEDNIRLQQLDLYVDEEKVDTYGEDALTEAAGTITYEAGSRNNWQTLKVVTTDKAGNQSEQQVRFLLTSNLWIQYIHNTPLLIGTGVTAAALILLVILLKRKKDQKEQKNGGEA